MIRVIEQTDEEKMAMYMKFPKKELAQMLINCNRILDARPITVTHMEITTNCSGCGRKFCDGTTTECRGAYTDL